VNEATNPPQHRLFTCSRCTRFCAHMESISGQKPQGKYFIALLKASCVRSILGLIGSGRVVHERSELYTISESLNFNRGSAKHVRGFRLICIQYAYWVSS